MLLLARLETIHHDPFGGTSRERFEADLRALAAGADDRTAIEFMAGAMRLLAGHARDGHTGIVAFGQDAALEAVGRSPD